MPKVKKKSVRRPAPKAPQLPAPPLAARILEQAAQGWLQSSGAAAPARPTPGPARDQHLAEALMETLRDLRVELADLRMRLDRLEGR